MAKNIVRVVVFFVVFWVGSVFNLNAQTQKTTDFAKWPVCQLGGAPIAPGPAPKEAEVFPAKGGPVVMSELGRDGKVVWVRCRLPKDTPSYRGADGVLRDVASNQPYFPVDWDAKALAALNGLPGKNGEDGYTPRKGVDYFDGKPGQKGDKGDQGPQGRDGKDGFCLSRKCKWALAAIGGGIAYTTYYYWPCIVGGQRR